MNDKIDRLMDISLTAIAFAVLGCAIALVILAMKVSVCS